jgi:hypothetical protein
MEQYWEFCRKWTTVLLKNGSLLLVLVVLLTTSYTNTHVFRRSTFNTNTDRHPTYDNVMRNNASTIDISNFRRSLFLDHENRIVGGTPVEEGEFPFFTYPIGMLTCGATLIHPEYAFENTPNS